MNTSNNLDCIAWNTGRWYSAHGQRIAAAVLVNGRIAFVDVDRHINGVTRHAFLGAGTRPFNHRRLQAFVMHEYDNCAYDDIQLAERILPPGTELMALRHRLTLMAAAVESAELDPPPIG